MIMYIDFYTGEIDVCTPAEWNALKASDTERRFDYLGDWDEE